MGTREALCIIPALLSSCPAKRGIQYFGGDGFTSTATTWRIAGQTGDDRDKSSILNAYFFASPGFGAAGAAESGFAGALAAWSIRSIFAPSRSLAT